MDAYSKNIQFKAYKKLFVKIAGWKKTVLNKNYFFNLFFSIFNFKGAAGQRVGRKIKLFQLVRMATFYLAYKKLYILLSLVHKKNNIKLKTPTRAKNVQICVYI